ncbi:MAG: hypothetical protein MUP02_08930 [Actinobacteria bacterium]|nr:hypothetical protein [Actinomycetota bacterium]
MQDQNGWFDYISAEIDRQKQKFSPREYKVYKFDQLIRISKRLNDFFPDCIDCQNMKREMEIIICSLDNLVRSSREEQKNYFNAIDNMVKHLKEKHNLIYEGHNLALWLPLGVGIGLPLGIPMGNIALGIPIGLAIGVAIGVSLDAKAKREGRVI